MAKVIMIIVMTLAFAVVLIPVSASIIAAVSVQPSVIALFVCVLGAYGVTVWAVVGKWRR